MGRSGGRIIREEAPPTPSTRLRALGDKLAGPPTVVYRLRKFVARNRTAVLATAAVAAALVIGTIAATLGFIEANKERRTAVAARQETDHANVRLQE